MAAEGAKALTPRLVPVHEDVQPYRYSSSFAALGGGLGLGGSEGGEAQPPLPAAPEQQKTPEEQPEAQRPPLKEDLEDFISLDDAPVEPAAPKNEQPPAAAEQGGGGGVASALLDDYVSLGIIEDPSAAAAKKAAAAARTTSRPEQLKGVPWAGSLKGIRSPLLRLHQEVVEFCRYLAPSPAEQAARQAAIDAIEDVVTSIWPKARVQVFGSFATGLYLPTSDVDAVVMGSGCTDVPQGLKALANALARRNMAKNMQVIAKAKVPIVKFEDAATGYNFDLSFDVANGPEAAENVRALMDSLPPMRPLVMVLKVFLQQRELNEVYSGGLGSYALLVMVAAFLQLHPSRLPPASAQRYGSAKAAAKPRELEACLGVLLVDFLRLYGRALNNMEVGVSCRKGGSFFSKRTKGFFQPDRPFLFAVEDPNDPENDLGRNSYNISRVRMAFDWAYCQLTAPADPGASLLQRIVRLDPVLFLRAPPPHADGDDPPPSPAGGSGSGKKSKKERKRERREREAAEEEAAAAERERKRAKKDKKRRHRERSMSDSDSDGGGGAQDEADAAERERKRAKKDKKRRHRERSMSDSERSSGQHARDAEEGSSSGEEAPGQEQPQQLKRRRNRRRTAEQMQRSRERKLQQHGGGRSPGAHGGHHSSGRHGQQSSRHVRFD